MASELAYSSLSDSTSDLEIPPSPSPEEKRKPLKNRCFPDFLQSFKFDRKDFEAFEVLWDEGEREKAVEALKDLLFKLAQTRGISNASTARQSEIETVTRIMSTEGSDAGKVNALLSVYDRIIDRWLESITLTKNVEQKNLMIQRNDRSSIFTTKTSHGAPLVIKVFKGAVKRDSEGSVKPDTVDDELDIQQFKNLLADQGDSFAPILGYSIVLNKEMKAVKELHIVMPCATKNLKDFLAVRPSLVDAVHLTFQLVRMVEEMRFNSKVLKMRVISSHSDIKTDNVILFRLPPPFGWLAFFIDAETANAGTNTDLGPNTDPDRTVVMSAKDKNLLNTVIQRAHLQDMTRLGLTINEIWQKIDEKKKAGLADILKNFDYEKKDTSTMTPDHIFMKSLDLHVFCFGTLCGFKSPNLFTKLKELIIAQPLPDTLSQLKFVDLPDETEEGPFNWLYLTKKEGRLFVNCTFTKQRPQEDACVLYCSTEHAFTAQSHALTVLCQILEHLTLYFPFDPLLSTGEGDLHSYQRLSSCSSQGSVSSSQ